MEKEVHRGVNRGLAFREGYPRDLKGKKPALGISSRRTIQEEAYFRDIIKPVWYHFN